MRLLFRSNNVWFSLAVERPLSILIAGICIILRLFTFPIMALLFRNGLFTGQNRFAIISFIVHSNGCSWESVSRILLSNALVWGAYNVKIFLGRPPGAIWSCVTSMVKLDRHMIKSQDASGKHSCSGVCRVPPITSKIWFNALRDSVVFRSMATHFWDWLILEGKVPLVRSSSRSQAR